MQLVQETATEETIVIDGVSYPIVERTFEGVNEEARGLYEVTYPYIRLNNRLRRVHVKNGEYFFRESYTFMRKVERSHA